MSNMFRDIATSGLDANKPTVKPALATELPNTFAFYYATDTQIMYKWNGTAWDSLSAPKAQLVGAALTGAAIQDITYLLNTAAGSVLTLPAATGSGVHIKVVVITTATSGAHKILTSPITDVLIGQAVGATAAGATLKFSAGAAGAFHSIQMPFAGTQPSGGFDGDVFDFTDVAAGKWHVEGMYQAGTTATTPFSTATT